MAAYRAEHRRIVSFLSQAEVTRLGRADPGATALHFASRHGRKAVVKQLLSAGADLNAQDGRGRTPLSEAAYEGHAAVVRLLLEGGADADRADNAGETPFALARRRGHEKVLTALQRR